MILDGNSKVGKAKVYKGVLEMSKVQEIDKLRITLVNSCIIFTQILREDYTMKDLKRDCEEFVKGVEKYIKSNTEYFIKDSHVRKTKRKK